MADFSGSTFITTERHDTYPAIDPAKSDLSGKVILITGASRGIGEAIALAFAQSGAKGLVLLARSDISKVKAACLSAQRAGHPLEVLTMPVDVSNNDQVVAAVKKAEEVFGRLDIVVNNAAFFGKYSYIADSDPDSWWKTWDINLRGVYHVIRATLPLLVKCDGDKTIVNVSSIGANIIIPRLASYQTSKLALLRLTEFVDAEYGGQGVLTYSIHPGSVKSEMSKLLPPEYQHVFIDSPELAAHTLLWLVKERRDWLAARYIDCNWDMEGLLAKKEEIVQGDKLKPKLVV